MIEREGLAMVYVVEKFRNYLLGGHYKLYTDHSTLKYLVNKSVLGGGYLDGWCCFRSIISKSL